MFQDDYDILDLKGLTAMFEKYLGSFCEIKSAATFEKICIGYITDVDENSISLDSAVYFSNSVMPLEFDSIITVLGKIQGLQVFKTHVIFDASRKHILLGDLDRIVDADRRCDTRISSDILTLVTISDEPRVAYDGVIKDISLCGISLWVGKALAIDEIITIQFPMTFDVANTHFCNCRIVRFINAANNNLRKYGCEFVDLKPENRAAIQSFVNKERAKLMKQRFSW